MSIHSSERNKTIQASAERMQRVHGRSPKPNEKLLHDISLTLGLMVRVKNTLIVGRIKQIGPGGYALEGRPDGDWYSAWQLELVED